jgi:hypothetical protein
MGRTRVLKLGAGNFVQAEWRKTGDNVAAAENRCGQKQAKGAFRKLRKWAPAETLRPLETGKQ